MTFKEYTTKLISIYKDNNPKCLLFRIDVEEEDSLIEIYYTGNKNDSRFIEYVEDKKNQTVTLFEILNEQINILQDSVSYSMAYMYLQKLAMEMYTAYFIEKMCETMNLIDGIGYVPELDNNQPNSI